MFMDKKEFIEQFESIPDDVEVMIAINTGDGLYYQSELEVKLIEEDETVYIIHDF